MRTRGSSGPLLIAALALGVPGSAGAQIGRTAEYDRFPVGTVLKARLDDRLSSAQARPGQRFTATVQSDDDRSGLPEGTRVVGVVREARAASRTQPGVLDVDFTTLDFPNGRVYPISGALTSLDSNSVSRSANGRLVAKRSKSSDRTKFIGYGAGAGAIIALLGKGNLLTNALFGAAGGYVYQQLQKDKSKGGYANVDLKEGAEFGVRLTQQFAYTPASDVRRDRSTVDRPLDRIPREGEAQLGTLYRDDETARTRRDRVTDRDRTPLERDRLSTLNRTGAGIAVTLDDRAVMFGTARPMRSGDTVMVPLVPVMRAAGARYFYNPITREVSITTQQGTVRGAVGSATVTANGERVPLAEPIRNTDGVLYAPDQFLELAAGLRTSWDERTQTLRLTRPTPERDRDRRDGGL